jgi:mono/diheme cytochrome c family protein
MKHSTRILLVAGALVVAPSAALADAAAGKAKFDAVCSDCHEVADHSGKAPAELTKQLQGISNGTIKHKGKVKLNDTEIADLVAYLTGTKSAAATPAAPAPISPASKSTTASPASGATPPASTAATPSSASPPAAKTAATGASAATGRAAFEKTCSSCHEPKDFAGKSAADLEKSITGISKGTVKHKKKFAVSAADAKALAAYLAGPR